MLPLVLLPWLAAASPQLIRKHPPHHVLSVAAHGELNEERAPTGHKYRHLAGLSAAFEEMKAITKRAEAPEDVASTSTDECAGAGAECKKVVDFLGDKLPVEKDEKLQFLCAPAALDCLSANMDKCRAVHEQLSALQHRWQCEAVKCSKSGPDCSMTVLYLEMDDHQLSEDQRNRKTRFLCSNQAKKCVSDHKDVCKTAYDIVSVANDLGHCDRSRCSDVSIDCSMAVTYLTEDHISNVTFKASTAKWTYLCEDAAFSCLEKNMEVCGRYYNALKLAFAEGHCNSARCAKEGPDCATAVKYLSEPDKQYSEQELQAKNDFLCSDKAVACIGSHPTCSEFHLPAKAAFESTKCPVTLRSESAAKQGPAPEEPKVDTKLAAEADPQLTAQKAAEIAYSKKQEKEKADKEKQILAFAAKQKNAGAEEELEATKKAKAEEAAEAKKKGLTILAGAVVVLVALVGGTVWYIRRRKAAAKGDGKAEKGKPPKPKKPGLLKKLKNPLKNPLKKSAEQTETDESEAEKTTFVQKAKRRFKKYGLSSLATIFKKKSPQSEAEDGEEGEGEAEADSPKEQPSETFQAGVGSASARPSAASIGSAKPPEAGAAASARPSAASIGSAAPPAAPPPATPPAGEPPAGATPASPAPEGAGASADAEEPKEY